MNEHLNLRIGKTALDEIAFDKMASCQNIAQVSPKIDEKLAVQATLIEAQTIW